MDLIASGVLFSLADLELRCHNEYRRQQGLDALQDPAAHSQFRALCYRQISARLGHAVAKATVMRLLANPRLPVPLPVDRAFLARNRPDPADSFPPPVLLLCLLLSIPPLYPLPRLRLSNLLSSSSSFLLAIPAALFVFFLLLFPLFS